MKTGKHIVRIVLALALVISMMAAMSVGAFASQFVIEAESLFSNGTVYGVPEVGDTIPAGCYILKDGWNITLDGETLLKHGDILSADATATYVDKTNKIIRLTTVPNTDYVDLETSAINDSSETFAQNYDLTLSGGTYTDVTKVKLEWTAADITATRTDNKTWDPDTLTWKATTDTNTVTVSQNGSTTFTLTNLSSTQIAAAVTFAQGSTFTAPTVAFTVDGTAADTGTATLGTVVNSDKTITSTNDHDAVIGVTVTPEASDFKALAAANDYQYGTYTVTISAVTAD